LVIEQNVKQSPEMADRAYELENGSIVLNGKSGDLPENDHVRITYLGLRFFGEGGVKEYG
jgi:branched-chain amino acid transport system ATP-binding protein